MELQWPLKITQGSDRVHVRTFGSTPCLRLGRWDGLTLRRPCGPPLRPQALRHSPPVAAAGPQWPRGLPRTPLWPATDPRREHAGVPLGDSNPSFLIPMIGWLQKNEQFEEGELVKSCWSLSNPQNVSHVTSGKICVAAYFQQN